MIDKLALAIKQWHNLQPLPQDEVQRLNKRFVVDYNYNSNHLEGNTLTYGQTQLLLLYDTSSGQAPFHDFQQMKASNVGLQMIIEQSKKKQEELSQVFIRNLHRILLVEDYQVHTMLEGNIPTTYTIHAGQYKTRPNSVITRYRDVFQYTSPEQTPALMTDLIDWYNLEQEKKDFSPLELAALFHYKFIRIHPFEDGNGRMVRLLTNYILLKNNYPMIIIRNKDKQNYLDALHQTDLIIGNKTSLSFNATLKQIKPFYKYMCNVLTKEINNDILFVTQKDDNIWWYNGEQIKFRTSTYNKILKELQQDNQSTLQTLYENTSINRSTIQKLLRTLQQKGYIYKDDNSQWHIFNPFKPITSYEQNKRPYTTTLPQRSRI